MRIGYVTYGLDKNPTGIGRYAVQLGNALCEVDPSVELVVLSTERGDIRTLFPEAEIHQVPGTWLLPLMLTTGNASISATAAKLSLDVIHDPNGIAPFFGPRLGVPRTVTVHDAFAYVCPHFHNRLDNWRYRYHLPAALRRADAVLTVSECSRRDLMRYLSLPANRLHEVPEGIDDRFRPVEDAQACRDVLDRYRVSGRYVLYVGGLTDRKNVATLLSAFDSLGDDHRDVSLVVAGKRQWSSANLDQVVRRLEAKSRIVFTGYVRDEDLPYLYSAAEVFAFPSLYEGFGLPPLEAMACGTPVISSNVSSLPEVLADAALFVDPLDVNQLRMSISSLLTSPAQRAELRSRGLQRAAAFRWEETAARTLQVFRDVAA